VWILPVSVRGLEESYSGGSRGETSRLGNEKRGSIKGFRRSRGASSAYRAGRARWLAKIPITFKGGEVIRYRTGERGGEKKPTTIE